MKNFGLVLLLILVQLLNAQNCEKVDSKVKQVFRGTDQKTYIPKYFHGGCIDSNKVLHVTLEPDGFYNAMWVAQGLSMNNAVMYTTLDAMFDTAKKIFKKFNEIEYYKIYFATFTDITDEYGNKTGKSKKLNAVMGISRETAEKINWDFVDSNLLSSIIMREDETTKKIVKMLDHISINP